VPPVPVVVSPPEELVDEKMVTVSPQAAALQPRDASAR